MFGMELPLDGRTRAGLRRIILEGIGSRLREGQMTSVARVGSGSGGGGGPGPRRLGGMPGERDPGTRDAEAIYGAREINAVEDESRR